jgi:hypothetical protein
VKDAEIHAYGANGDDRTLCGIADEGNPGELDSPSYAKYGEMVTCKDCLRIIMHCKNCYTNSGKAK